MNQGLHLGPNAAVALLTLGLLLVYYELNRPGSILPGALGLLAALFSLAALYRLGISPVGSVLVLSAISLLALDLLRPTSMLVALAATLALVLGLRLLVTREAVTVPIAAGCGLLLGAGTSILTRIARRARANKGLD